MIKIEEVSNDVGISFLNDSKAYKEKIYVSKCDKWFGAFEGDKIVGVIGLLGKRVRCFFVLKEYRKQGIGSELLSTLLSRSDKEWYSAYVTEYSMRIFIEYGFEIVSVNEKTGIRFVRLNA